MKVLKKIVKNFKKHKLAGLILIVTLLLVISYLRTPPQKYNNDIPSDGNPKISPEAEVSYKDLSFDIPANWKTYTTSSIMDTHTDVLKKLPEPEIPSLSFRYPDTWYIEIRPAQSTWDPT